MKTKFNGFLTLLLALVVQISFAQQKTVSGTVTDDDGMPLFGVFVQVQGTDAGTQTDFDGNYSINVNQGAVLNFTLVGYRDRSVTVGAGNVINVTLEQGETLDEVLISTGYQTTTKRRSTKAVTTILSEDIEDQPTASVITAMQGKIPGLNIGNNSGQPGTSGTILLRGVGSIQGETEPIFIIDGIETLKSNFTNLNGNDIESVSVLKGPNAVAIYGNRGANGVIVVTTKGGKYNQKLSIGVRSQYGMAKIMPLNMRIMNSYEKLTFERDNNVAGSMGQGLTDGQINDIAGKANTYWGDYFFRTAQTNRQDLTLTSGSDNITSATSLSYMNQEGTFIASELQRFGFRNKINGRSNDGKFNYASNVNMTFSRSDFNPNEGGRSLYFNPFLISMQAHPAKSPFDPDGSITTDGGFTALPQSDITNIPYVLLNSAHMNTQFDEQFNVNAGFHADYNFAKNWTAAVDLNTTVTEFKSRNITHPHSLLGPFQVDSRADFGGIQGESYQRDFRFTSRASLNYNTTVDKHTFDANAFLEYNKSHLDGLGYSTRGLDPKQIGTSNAFQFKVQEALVAGGDPEYVYVPSTNLSLTGITIGLFSYFGTFDYDYDDRFGLSGSIRRDASPRFTDDNKWGTFWSVAGRWNIDGEKFMENSAFNLLKLRVAYGTAGQQRITGSYWGGLDLFKNLYVGGIGYNNAPAYVPSGLANTALKWETTKQFNAGIDFAVWKNKLQGNLDIYEKKTIDLYDQQPISWVFGTSAMDANIGSMQNRGVELFLQYTLIDTKDWRFSVSANGSYNKNKILELGSADEDGLVHGGGARALKIGESFGEYYVARYAGVNPANGNALFYDIDGNLTERLRDADRVFRNLQSIPEVQGGFGAVLSYKNFTLAQNWVFFDRVWRNNLDLADMEGTSNYNEFNAAYSLFSAWQQPGDITGMPRLNAGIGTIDHINGSDRYVHDASYLRMRNISLTYTLGKEHLARLPIDGLSVYVQGENLLTFTKYQGYDPESGYSGTESSRYPSSHFYSIGVNLNF